MRRTYSFLLACLLLAGSLAGCQTPSEPAPEPVTVSCLTGLEVMSNRSGDAYLWQAFTYNENGQLLEKSYHDGDGMTVYERRTYNEKGVLITFEDYNRNEVYTYDSQGKLLTKTGPNSSETYTYEYDKDGNVRKKTIEYTGENPRSVTYVYTYDAQGRKTSETTGDRMTTYTYDAQGNCIKVESYRDGILISTDERTNDAEGRKLPACTYDAYGNPSIWQKDEKTSYRFTYQQIAVPAARAKSIQHEQEGLLQYLLDLILYPVS